MEKKDYAEKQARELTADPDQNVEITIEPLADKSSEG